MICVPWEDKIYIFSNLKKFLQSFGRLLVYILDFNFFLDIFYKILTQRDIVINRVVCYLYSDVFIFKFRIKITFHQDTLINTGRFSCPCLFRLLEDRHENTNWHLNKYNKFIHYLYTNAFLNYCNVYNLKLYYKIMEFIQNLLNLGNGIISKFILNLFSIRW